jgi:hypothetical protein
MATCAVYLSAGVLACRLQLFNLFVATMPTPRPAT